MGNRAVITVEESVSSDLLAKIHEVIKRVDGKDR